MITNKNKAKTIEKHISCYCMGKFNSITCNSNQKQNNKICQYECKSYRYAKKDYSWNPRTCICESGKYLKTIGDDLKIVCDKIIYVIDIVSTKMKNNMATSYVSINSDFKRGRYKIDCYTLQSALLVIILLLLL